MNTADCKAGGKVPLLDALTVIVFASMIITVITLGVSLITEPRSALSLLGMLVLEFVVMIFLALADPKRKNG